MKILLGGSPCQNWSVAQKNNRETESSGIGWELFKNYLIAKEKYKPDYFLYENVKSMSKAIREQIDIEFNKPYMKLVENGGGWQVSINDIDKHNKRWLYENIKTREQFQISRLMINSALVSAQNRERYYWTNIPNVTQPEDRGILLRDILESGTDLSQNEKAYWLTTRCSGAIPSDTLLRKRHSMVAEAIDICPYVERKVGDIVEKYGHLPQNINPYHSKEILDKTPTTTAQMGSQTSSATVLRIEPVCLRYERTDKGKELRKQYEQGDIKHGFNEHRELHPRADGKTNTLTTVSKDNMVAEPIRIGCYPSPDGTLKNSQGMRLYSIDGKSVNLTAQGGGMGAKTGLYAVPIEYPIRKNSSVVIGGNCIRCKQNKNGATVAESCCYYEDGKCGTLTTARAPMVIKKSDGKTHPVYEVRNGLITIKDKQYPVKLADGYYIIRKLTITECCRLQTIPEWYVMPCSATQNYKMLGNGWTIDVVKHILSHIPNMKDVEVLSMYDGMSCGQIALTEMGCNILQYYATEIDKYCTQTVEANFPKTIHMGDAFQVRDENWNIGGIK